MRYQTHLFILIAAIAFLSGGCAAKIYGTVELVDQQMQPIEGENPKGKERPQWLACVYLRGYRADSGSNYAKE